MASSAAVLPTAVPVQADPLQPLQPACDSCETRPAVASLSWPDTPAFLVCWDCVPPHLVHLTRPCPARPGRPAPAAAPSSPGPAAAAPSATISRKRRPSRTTSVNPMLSGAFEREVLLGAARTVVTSRPAPRGRRLTCDGGCDVLAALTLAAGGTVNEAGRPTPPSEPQPARHLRRVLAHLADQLSGCAVGRSWAGDPVELIDAWQASPELSAQTMAATLQTLAEAL